MLANVCLLFSLINSALSLYTTIPRLQGKCFSHTKTKNEKISIIFYITGKFEEENEITVIGPDLKELFHKENTKHETIKLNNLNNGLVQFCVKNKSKDKITLTFQFQAEKQDEILSVSVIEDFVKAIKQISHKIDLLENNIKNTVIRKNLHFHILDSEKKQINFYAFIKIVFLLVFAYIQIKTATSVIQNVKVNKEIKIEENSPLKMRRDNNSYSDIL